LFLALILTRRLSLPGALARLRISRRSLPAIPVIGIWLLATTIVFTGRSARISRLLSRQTISRQ
jgi:hypothetical protein